MDYGAITIDTSIFDEKGLALESGILKTLEQFKGRPLHLVLSEMVVREVHGHLKKKAGDAREQVLKALRDSKKHLSASEGEVELAKEALVPDVEDGEVAKRRLAAFVASTGAEIIPAVGQVDLDQIIKRYFESAPPFAATGNKKNEFPDAIALLSLESWGKKNGCKILAVAKDNDWKRFADDSEYIEVIEDLAEAISKFQPPSDAIQFCSRISTTLPQGRPEELYDLLSGYLEGAVENLVLYPEATSQFYYDPEYVDVSLVDFDFVLDKAGNALLQPVQGRGELLVVEAKINVIAEAAASLSLSVRDSIDKDYVIIGHASASETIEFESEVLLTFEGDFSQGEEGVELTGFELLSYPTEVDFGEIEPDWWSEDQTV
ncbi:PIN domain-containing protein [Marinobacter sp. chi1]|uniref:PIN domain-containing protein n=1 Tax=Marinobacter suaedae TaxID=3057675 RepID=A0ABT8W255_9GAMM|nr:PIN domain-containing protein [Marinobacter sp. chi1]MDO3722243.1 PIN domain-containing protein [Marinobacter sp. chi1]